MKLIALGALVVPLVMTSADFAYGESADVMEEVVVTGSRIRRDPLNECKRSIYPI
jgi:hypothetical protein